MKIFITGGTGFVGSHLIKKLAREGHQLFVLARTESNAGFLHQQNVKTIIGDLNNPASYQIVFNQHIDMVYHLAALAGNDPAISKSQYWQTNVLATAGLLESCYKKINKFIYCSSLSASDLMISRSGVYGHSKKAAEDKVIEYKNKGLDAVIIRPAIVYGPGDFGPIYQICRLVKKGFVFVVGHGRNYLPLVFIDDLIEILLLVGFSEKLSKIYEIIGPGVTLDEVISDLANNLSIKSRLIKIPGFLAWIAALFSELFCPIFGKQPLLTRQRVAILTADIKSSDFTSNLPIKSNTIFSEGIKKTINWYKDNGYL